MMSCHLSSSYTLVSSQNGTCFFLLLPVIFSVITLFPPFPFYFNFSLICVMLYPLSRELLVFCFCFLFLFSPSSMPRSVSLSLQLCACVCIFHRVKERKRKGEKATSTRRMTTLLKSRLVYTPFFPPSLLSLNLLLSPAYRLSYHE